MSRDETGLPKGACHHLLDPGRAALSERESDDWWQNPSQQAEAYHLLLLDMAYRL
jgi:hypothetical protein